MKIFERVIFPIMIGALVALLITYRCSNEQPQNITPTQDHVESLADIGSQMNEVYDASIQQLLFERDSLTKRLKVAQKELKTMQQVANSQRESLSQRITTYEEQNSSQERLTACDSLVGDIQEHLKYVAVADSLCDNTQSLLETITVSTDQQVTMLVAKASHWEVTAHAAIVDRDWLKAENEGLTRKWKNGRVIQKVLATGLVVAVVIVGAHYTMP